jgi:hypothetical protein
MDLVKLNQFLMPNNVVWAAAWFLQEFLHPSGWHLFDGRLNSVKQKLVTTKLPVWVPPVTLDCWHWNWWLRTVNSTIFALKLTRIMLRLQHSSSKVNRNIGL